MSDPYDADYFLRGKETGKSLYENYRWLPDLTVPMCRAIAAHMGMQYADTILDFGCARGYAVRALRNLGYDAIGVDVSQWALDNCDPVVREYVYSTRMLMWCRPFKYVIAKDVLEHLDSEQLAGTLGVLQRLVTHGMLVVVPLSKEENDAYIVPEYEKDVTHKIRWPLSVWKNLLEMIFGDHWTVDASYRLPGVKDNYYADYPTGNGFLTVKRKP